MRKNYIEGFLWINKFVKSNQYYDMISSGSTQPIGGKTYLIH